MSARLPVHGGLWTLVDEDVAERFTGIGLWRNGSYVCFGGMNAQGQPRAVYLHRRILQVDGVSGTEVDHINGDPLDNRRENLRLVSRKENLINRGMLQRNKSGFKGVVFNPKKSSFTAYIGIDGKTKNLGSFKTAVEAALAFDQAALSTMGNFAVLNNPFMDEDGQWKSSCRVSTPKPKKTKPDSLPCKRCGLEVVSPRGQGAPRLFHPECRKENERERLRELYLLKRST